MGRDGHQAFAFVALPMAAVWLYTICDEMIALFTVRRRALNRWACSGLGFNRFLGWAENGHR